MAAAAEDAGVGLPSEEVTPLVIDGIMYLSTPYSRVVALEPDYRKRGLGIPLPSGAPSTRGVEYWPGDAQTPAQIVFGSSDGKLYSLNAKTGKPNDAFGDNGIVNMNTPEIMQGLPGRNALTSPPIVYKNLVITGGTTQENPPKGPAGDVRAWNMQTGKLAWTFHSIPRAGEKYNDSWAGESWKNRSASTCGVSSPWIPSAASYICRSARRRSTSTAAIAPATICSAPVWWRRMRIPENICGTSRSSTTTYGTPNDGRARSHRREAGRQDDSRRRSHEQGGDFCFCLTV